MSSSPSDHAGGPNDLLIAITESLEACGLKNDAYRLHDYVDVEALEQLLASSDGDIVVQFSVRGVQLAVSQESVEVLIEEPPDSVDE